MQPHSTSLGTESVGKLLLKLSTPAIIGMMVQTLYNIVDTIFIGQGVGPIGIAGLTIVFPIQMLIMALGMTIGVGGASIISRSLGAQNMERARLTLGNLFVLAISSSLVVAILGRILAVPLLRLFGATETILPYSLEYFNVILIGAVFLNFSIVGNSVIRAEGKAKIAMITMSVSAIINIILDPIFIFGFDMGIRGAAVATVISQMVMAGYLFYYFTSGKSIMTFTWRAIRLKADIVKETFAVGASSLARNSASSISAIIINNTLAMYGGDITIAVYGTMNRLFMFAFMPMFGIIQGMQPIVGYNYGARQYQRVIRAIKLANLTTTMVATVAFLCFMLIPGLLLRVFSSDAELIRVGTSAIRIMALAFPVIGVQVVGGSVYQSLGKALPALVLSMARQILFLIPLVVILPIFFGLTGVWLAFVFSDILAFAITYILLNREIGHLGQRIVELSEEMATP